MKIKRLVFVVILSLFLVGMIDFARAQLPTISVEPPSITDPMLVPGSSFSVDIQIADVTNLGGYEFKLGYDPGILTATTVTYNDDPEFFHSHFTWTEQIVTVNETHAHVWLVVTLPLGTMEGVDGTGVVVTIDFTVDDVGETVLGLFDTILGDPLAQPFDHDVVDGYFNNVPPAVGWISGTVTDDDTGLAIEGATVTADGVSDVTDAAGNYTLELSPGTYDVTAEMTGYVSETVADVSVAVDATVDQDFALAPEAEEVEEEFPIYGLLIILVIGAIVAVMIVWRILS